MKSSGRNISLTSYDDIFSSEESRSGTRQERVQEIPLAQLRPFKDHPFRVVDDERMTETAESIKDYGVLVPAIARPLPDGGYELVSGHRRKRACEMAGLETMPVIIRELDDDAAVIIMVDSNLQRENILPSERAKAYQMKYEALKHQGQRRDLTSGQNVQKSESSLEQVAEGSGDSAKTVQRVMRLNNLVPEMLSMVDDKKVAITPAVELSYLKPEEQQQLVEAMETCQSTPSLSQAQRMKRFSQQGKLTGDVMEEIMSEEKKPPLDKVILTGEKIRKFFPKSYTPEQMEKVIIKLLETWYRKRMQSHER
ncbi:MAG: ParB/RepB/Spo0J family partition protein [Oscillospiraceae bacterium]|nr:ParB/RepB/Spo0J family partition protein [Oscillospiraceae bacterium]